MCASWQPYVKMLVCRERNQGSEAGMGAAGVCPRCHATCQQAATAAQETLRAQLEDVFSLGTGNKPFNRTQQQTGALADAVYFTRSIHAAAYCAY